MLRSLSARLARYAVCTSQPSAVRPTVRYQRTALRTTNRASSLSSARPYVPAKQRTFKRSMAPTLPAAVVATLAALSRAEPAVTFGGPAVMPPQAGHPESRRRPIVRIGCGNSQTRTGLARRSGGLAPWSGPPPCHLAFTRAANSLARAVRGFLQSSCRRGWILWSGRSAFSPWDPVRRMPRRSLPRSASQTGTSSRQPGPRSGTSRPHRWLPVWAWALVLVGGVGTAFLIRYLGLEDGDRLRERAEAASLAGDWSKATGLWRRINAGSRATGVPISARGGFAWPRAGSPGRTGTAPVGLGELRSARRVAPAVGDPSRGRPAA